MITKKSDTALSSPHRSRRRALWGALMGAIIFVLLYGVRVLDPTQTAWLLGGGDISQHYLGWELYRASPLRLPFLGISYNTVYPHRISIVYTDSIPLLALLFKPFSALLPNKFQYLGLWGLLCFMLQGYLGYRLIARIGRAEDGTLPQQLAVLCGTGAVILYPALVIRMFGHTALAGNWLILLALWLWLDEETAAPTTLRACLLWGLMGIFAAGFHLYYLPMMGIVLVGISVRRAIRLDGWRKKLIDALTPIAAYCGCAFAELFVMGAFSGNFSGTSNDYLDGADLLGLFLPRVSDELETNSFAGYGTLLACIAALVLLVIRFCRHPGFAAAWARHRSRLISACVIVVLSVLAAASNTLSIAGLPLGTLPMPGFIMQVWTMFSSCSRLAWVAGYLLLVCACGLCLRLGGKVALPVLALCFLAQGCGQASLLAQRHTLYYSDACYAESPLTQGNGWQTLADSGLIDHMAFVTADWSLPDYWATVAFAAEHRWTTNIFYLAHMDRKLAQNSIEGVLAAPEPRTLYVLPAGDELRRADCSLYYYRLNGILLGSLEQLPLPTAEENAENIIPTDLSLLSFQENSASTYNSDGTITLAGGEAISGPGWHLPAGTYIVTLTGDGFDHSYIFSGWHEEKDPYQELPIVFLDSNASTISFQFSVYEPLYGWEVSVHTLDDRPIQLNSLTVARVS